MRRFKLMVLAVVLAISACATTMLGKETQALDAVTATLTAATAQFRAGKMSKETHANIIVWADASKAGITAAVKSGEPAKLTAIQAEAESGLVAIQKGEVK